MVEHKKLPTKDSGSLYTLSGERKAGEPERRTESKTDCLRTDIIGSKLTKEKKR